MTKAPSKGQKSQALYALHWMPGISPSARAVGAWLVWHANASTGRCDPGQAKLQQETGYGRRAVQMAINDLISSKVVDRQLHQNTSSSYTINWQKLAEIVSDYEAKAKAREAVVTSVQRKEGRKKLRRQAHEIAPPEVHEIAPKLSEPNVSEEKPVFRVGVTLDKSRADVDDALGRKILGYYQDAAFVAGLDRAITGGKSFSPDLSEKLYERLETIREDHGDHGDSIGGRAYRLLETDLVRGEAA